jgi:hypothetical protein
MRTSDLRVNEYKLPLDRFREARSRRAQLGTLDANHLV